jgi:hypothetical protein
MFSDLRLDFFLYKTLYRGVQTFVQLKKKKHLNKDEI